MRDARGPVHPCLQSWIAVSLTLLFAASASLWADIKLPAPAPPQADPQTVHVVRGGAATIPLRAHYGGGGTVSFSIVKRPEHGTLSDLRLLGDNRANINYQNDGSAPATRDRFTYVVKSSDRVSSPAEVTILVEEAPPKLRVPDQIEFREIRAGESATQNFVITNAGGGVLEGRLTASAPWALGSTTYRVSAGATESIALVFRPTEARSFVGQITLFGSDGAQATIPLLGSASSPIGIEPAELRIGLPEEKSAPRRGAVSLTNRTEQELPLKLAASSRIRPVADLVLAAGATKKVEIEITADRSVPVHEQIAIVGPGFRRSVSVEAQAEPLPTVETKSAATSSAAPSSGLPAATPAPRLATVGSLQTAATPSATPSAGAFIAVGARRLDSSRWELHWRQPGEPVAKYRIEERLLALNGSEVETSWQPLEAPEISSSSGEIVARIGGLDPERLHMLRVTALGPGGAVQWESPLVALAPPREAAHGGRGWLIALGVALVVLVAMRWRARRT